MIFPDSWPSIQICVPFWFNFLITVFLLSFHLHYHILDIEQLISLWLQTILNWYSCFCSWPPLQWCNLSFIIDPESYNFLSPPLLLLCFELSLITYFMYWFSSSLSTSTLTLSQSIPNKATRAIILKVAMSCQFYGKMGNGCQVFIAL